MDFRNETVYQEVVVHRNKNAETPNGDITVTILMAEENGVLDGVKHGMMVCLETKYTDDEISQRIYDAGLIFNGDIVTVGGMIDLKKSAPLPRRHSATIERLVMRYFDDDIHHNQEYTFHVVVRNISGQSRITHLRAVVD